MNWISLSAESPGVICDENGVPAEWTLLRIGMHKEKGVPIRVREKNFLTIPLSISFSYELI